MTRIVTLRASIVFATLTVLMGAMSLASQTAVLSALLLVSGSVAALLMVFAAAPAQPAPIPVRVRDRRIAR
jgi:archaellum biogenesis protein FlaJ (TadC family)